jgi:hypothetical protein
MNVTELANAIMALFRENGCKAGDILQPQMILQFKLTLSPPEDGLFGNAVHDIKSREYITIEGSGIREQYRLTQAGYNHIYNLTTQGE